MGPRMREDGSPIPPIPFRGRGSSRGQEGRGGGVHGAVKGEGEGEGSPDGSSIREGRRKGRDGFVHAEGVGGTDAVRPHPPS